MPPPFPQFTVPPEPRNEPPPDVRTLIGRARRAQLRLAALYHGEVYRVLYDRIEDWVTGGWLFDETGRGRVLFDEILMTPLPERMPGA